MILLAQAALFLWLPVVVVIYTMYPPKKAVVNAFVIAWLFLPNIGFPLPGLPDYTKMTATVAAVLVATMIFDQSRLFSIKFRWYDAPMMVWCLSPFVTAQANGLGAYEGLSAIMEQTVFWGLPYLIGRAYLTDLESVRDLAEAIAIGGLLYVPLCLIEIKLSPVLAGWVYGLQRWEPLRYGGYRPKVFLYTGLELGMWMTAASFLCYMLWSCQTIKTIRNVSLGALTLVIIAVTILCKSTGSIALLMVAILFVCLVRWTKQAWPIWMLIAIPILYTATRTPQIWSGQQVVAIATATVGEDRAASFAYRLNMENLLTARAMERPILGWGRFNRFQVVTETGQWVSVPDGYWVIILGTMGIVGLSCLLFIMLAPMVLTIRRFPVETWTDPRVGPVVGLALILTLIMSDFLSNAMLNPIYPLIIGAILSQSPYRGGGNHREAEETLAIASELVGQGRSVEAGQEFLRTIELASGEDAEAQRIQAEALDGMGHTLLATGRPEEAVAALQDALVLRDRLAADSPEPERFRDLAIAREGLSRALAESGRTSEAIGERWIALKTWEILSADHPGDVEYRDHRVDTLNDLAWLLATDPNPELRDPARAVALAEEAVHVSADHDPSWNTLGVARFRAGDWGGAIEALERSALSAPGGQGTAFDHYFLSMAWFRLQHEDQAREWLERGIAWATRHRPGHLALARFRDEAESLLQDQHGVMTDRS